MHTTASSLVAIAQYFFDESAHLSYYLFIKYATNAAQ